MARPRTPTKVLEAFGAFKRNPNRRRPAETEVKTSIGNAPDQATAWREVVDDAPGQLLTSADRLAVALAAVLMAEFRENPRVFQAARMGRLHSSLGHFPNRAAERLNMGMDKKPKDNAFAGF